MLSHSISSHLSRYLRSLSLGCAAGPYQNQPWLTRRHILGRKIANRIPRVTPPAGTPRPVAMKCWRQGHFSHMNVGVARRLCETQTQRPTPLIMIFLLWVGRVGGEIVTTHLSSIWSIYSAKGDIGFGPHLNPCLSNPTTAQRAQGWRAVSPAAAAAAVPGFAAGACPRRAAPAELGNGFAAAHSPARLSMGLTWRLRGSLLALGGPYFPAVQVKSCK